MGGSGYCSAAAADSSPIHGRRGFPAPAAMGEASLAPLLGMRPAVAALFLLHLGVHQVGIQNGIKTHNLVRKFIKIEPAFLSWKSEAKLHSD